MKKDMPFDFSVTDIAPETVFAKTEQMGLPGWVTVVFSSDYIGKEDISHGEVLLLAFLDGLCQSDALPDEVIFYHRGVLLLKENHSARKYIEKLLQWDVQVLVSEESCEEYRIFLPEKDIPRASMQTICRHMLRADKLIYP